MFQPSSTLKGHLAAGSAYFIFGLNIVFCKDISICGLVSPLVLFSLRALGATALFWAISLFTDREKIPTKDLGLIFVASILGILVPQMTFLIACTKTTAIDISILSTLSPIFTMFIAAIAIKEPITFQKASGVAISFTGVILLIFNSFISDNGVDTSSPVGIGLMLLNSLSFASYLGIFRPLISKYSVVSTMKWMFLFSLIPTLPFSAKDLLITKYSLLSSKVILEISFVIFFSTFVAYYLIPVGQKNIRPTLVSMYTYLQPMVAAVVAIAIGMDRLCWKKLLAAILVIAGVVIVNRSRAKRP